MDEELIWIEKDIMINQLPIPIKDDHIFLGWFEIINGIVSDDIFNFNIMPIKNIDLIAKWEHMAVLSFQNAELLELGFDELILDIGTNIDIFMLNMVHAYNNDLEFHGISFVYKKGIEITGYTLINPGNSSYFTEDGAIVILKISVYDKNFEYEIKDGEIYIVGYKGTSRDLVLPSSYRGLNVVGIENSALSNKNLRQVVFSPYIRYIGDKAFLNNGLFLVEIINLLDLEYIGQSAFENNYITDVVLKDLPSLSRIDKRSFAFNTILNITLDDSPNIHNIDQDAFLGNNRISRINILGKTQKIVEDNSYWWPNRHKIFSTSSDLVYYGVEILNAAMFCSEIINWFDKLDIKYLSKDI